MSNPSQASPATMPFYEPTKEWAERHGLNFIDEHRGGIDIINAKDWENGNLWLATNRLAGSRQGEIKLYKAAPGEQARQSSPVLFCGLVKDEAELDRIVSETGWLN